MLPEQHRLRSTREFRHVFRRGRSWAHPLIALHVAPAEAGRRAGITVGKKVGPAVVRNRVRRRVREALRGEMAGWRQGFDLVLVLRPAAAEAGFGELRSALVELAGRAGLEREPDAAGDTLYTLPAGGRPPRVAGGGPAGPKDP